MFHLLLCNSTGIFKTYLYSLTYRLHVAPWHISQFINNLNAAYFDFEIDRLFCLNTCLRLGSKDVGIVQVNLIYQQHLKNCICEWLIQSKKQLSNIRIIFRSFHLKRTIFTTAPLFCLKISQIYPCSVDMLRPNWTNCRWTN